MTYNRILNNDLLYTLSRLGHTQTICICDAGLPIPEDKHVIDLSFIPGTVSFLDVYNEIVKACPFEKAYYATETEIQNPSIFNALKNSPFEKEVLSHEELKTMSFNCYAFIRTGECTPFANVILQAKTTF